MKGNIIVGVDEVGRGPLAGPLAVGALFCDAVLLRQEFRGVKESKQLTPEAREWWFLKIVEHLAAKRLNFAVTFISPAFIDEHGMAEALRRGIAGALLTLAVSPRHSEILLDGGIRAPRQFMHQKTIIKGDEKEPRIALASIVAKVLRDRVMVRYASLHPTYGFELHKGYGTAYHQKMIKKYGLSAIHRRTYIHGQKSRKPLHN